MPPINYLFFYFWGGWGGGARGGEREFRGYEIASVSIFGPKQCFSEVLGVHMQEYPPFLPIRPTALVSASKPIAN